MIIIDTDKETSITILRRYLNAANNPNTGANMSWMSDEFNPIFTETGLWEKYQAYNLSFPKYEHKGGWSNALFHFSEYTKTDLKNLVKWINLILEDEYDAQ